MVDLDDSGLRESQDGRVVVSIDARVGAPSVPAVLVKALAQQPALRDPP